MGKNRKRVNKRKQEEIVVEEEQLERFAGSSGEESENEQVPMKDAAAVEADVESSAEEESSSEDESEAPTDEFIVEKEDPEEKLTGPAGMAGAMSRILGSTAQQRTQSVILSKTKTPLQRQAEKEKHQEKQLKEKRKANREIKLAALHIPLSVATAAKVQSNSTSVAKELEQERVHRRVATRGVVALFNAIAQHQKKASDPGTSASTNGPKKTEVKKMNKQTFLDMIKSTAANRATLSEEKKANVKQKNINEDATESKPQWNALKDDYMLNPKKNWDQETSEESSEGNHGADLSEEDSLSSPSKKQRAIVE